MSAVTVAEFRLFVREVHDSALDPVLQEALDSAQEQVESFIGFPLYEFEDGVPSTIKTAIKALAMVTTEGQTGEKAEEAWGVVERTLRPYRRESGVRGA